MDISFVHVHFVFYDKVVDKLKEDLLVVIFHALSVAEVTMQETNLLWVGSELHKHITQFDRGEAQEQWRLVKLFLRQRLV